MREPQSEDPKRPSDAQEQAVLWAKYLDYCSAQLADLLLYLSPDEIFLVAEKAARERGERTSGSYAEMVQTATMWLSNRVSLPSFESWVEEYKANPALHDVHLMGFWEDELKGETDD